MHNEDYSWFRIMVAIAFVCVLIYLFFTRVVLSPNPLCPETTIKAWSPPYTDKKVYIVQDKDGTNHAQVFTIDRPGHWHDLCRDAY